jgi:hypothetical protein
MADGCKLHVFLGLGALGVALWLAISGVQGPWRLLAMVACVLIGSSAARQLVSLPMHLLEHTSLPADTMVYYLHALQHPLRKLVWFTGTSLTWALLFRPATDVNDPIDAALKLSVDYHTLVARGLLSFGVVLSLRCVTALVMKMMTAQLHTSTFWDQLHTTVRQELLLVELFGPPIRRRPGAAKSKPKLIKFPSARKGPPNPTPRGSGGATTRATHPSPKAGGSPDLIPHTSIPVVAAPEHVATPEQELGGAARTSAFDSPLFTSPQEAVQQMGQTEKAPKVNDLSLFTIQAAARHVSKGTKRLAKLLSEQSAMEQAASAFKADKKTQVASVALNAYLAISTCNLQSSDSFFYILVKAVSCHTSRQQQSATARPS